MIKPAGTDYTNEVLPHFRKENLDAVSLFFFSYFFRAEATIGDHSQSSVNFYNAGLGEGDIQGDKDTARRQTRRAFVHIDLSAQELQPMDSLIAWIPLPLTTLEKTLEKVVSLVKENGIFGLIFFQKRTHPNFWFDSFQMPLAPFSELYFDQTELDSGMTQSIRIIGQKSPPALNPGLSLGIISRNEANANKWNTYFEQTQFIRYWDWTKCATRLLSTSDQIKVLDAGCGAGTDTKYILSEFPKSQILGIDNAPQAEKYILPFLSNDARSRFQFQCQDLAKYEFPEETFDLIVSSNVLGFIDKTNATLIMEKMIASLKPGGVIVLTLFGEKGRIDGTQSTVTGEEVETIFIKLNIFAIQDRYRFETRKTPPQPQENIIIIAQKPLI